MAKSIRCSELFVNVYISTSKWDGDVCTADEVFTSREDAEAACPKGYKVQTLDDHLSEVKLDAYSSGCRDEAERGEEHSW